MPQQHTHLPPVRLTPPAPCPAPPRAPLAPWVSWLRPSSPLLFFFFSPLLILAAMLSLAGCPAPTPSLCTQDTECPSGQNCRQGRCEAIQKTCSNDKDCPPQQECFQTQCRDTLPSCQNNSQCSDGKLCIEGRCQQQLCTDDRNCPAGKRCSGGICIDQENTPSEEQAPEATPEDGGTKEASPDTPQPETTQEESPDNPSGFCIPNRDGILQRQEMTFRVGAAIVYTAAGSENSPVDVDLKGTQDATGTTVWDFQQKLPSDTREVEELLPYQGQWFESEIKDPTPSYTSILTRDFPLVGVVLGAYLPTNDALQLLGWFSQERNKAKVTYRTPVDVLRFPLKMGDTWSVKTTASGSFPQNFTLYSASEDYDFAVDAKGKAKTPAGTFDVLRLRFKLRQTQTLPVISTISRITYLFLAECFGVVARVESKLYESDENFTKASRLKRLSD